MNRILLSIPCLIFICCGPTNESKISDEKQKGQDVVIEEDKPDKGDTDDSIEGKISPSDNIRTDLYNSSLLNGLVEKMVNDIRLENGLSPLYSDQYLLLAAQDQTRYQVSQNQLTHDQTTSGKQNTRDRIRFHGGTFRSSGENVQYLGFMKYRDMNGIQIRPNSYEETAKEIVMNWRSSAGHYRNIINGQFRFVGTSILLNSDKQALYATQVFGG